MSRPSTSQRPLAVLRRTIGLTQSELAALVGCSERTIQSIELGLMPMGFKRAHCIADATGADATWLRANVCGSAPPVAISREAFDKHREGKVDGEACVVSDAKLIAGLDRLLVQTAVSLRAAPLRWKVARFIERLAREHAAEAVWSSSAEKAGQEQGGGQRPEMAEATLSR